MFSLLAALALCALLDWRIVGLANCWLSGDQVEKRWAAKQTAGRADERLNSRLFGWQVALPNPLTRRFSAATLFVAYLRARSNHITRLQALAAFAAAIEWLV